ncbi:hypothetical protein QTA58_05150 [Neorhizobium sp. CSC1952]|uniref:hypothetical protein n=1 Tax=Neorhizobium sp. CSC1952 TaxID=2978974 RepID=UPI0025A527D6|nr:hypothetical protein [Rhizobium sp. CSC1952]WJR68148.1 hypothetical protein QTA58_05150 [Rhizobium sp. CSC1952]
MAKLPPSFSLQAIEIRAALNEGRTEDAKRMVVELLRAGKADRVVQGIAADLLKPPKRGRGRRKALPQFWYDIGSAFHQMRDEGRRYEDSIAELAERFGFSESHVRNCIAVFDRDDDDREDRT